MLLVILCLLSAPLIVARIPLGANQMAPVITPNTPQGMALDVQGLPPARVVPDSLILRASYRAGFVEGDEPAVRVPYVDLDGDAGFVPEGNEISEADPYYRRRSSIRARSRCWRV
jgi:hypothetical protein